MINIGVVTSGRGTLLRYMISACYDGVVNGTVKAVVTNRDCAALDVGRDANLDLVESFPADEHGGATERDTAMADALQSTGVNFVLVAGYTERMSSAFLDAFPERVLSVYPTMLPAFGDLDESIGPALEYGVKALGVTFMIKWPDSLSEGPIVAQVPIPVDIDDTIESVTPKIAAVERQHLPPIVQAFAENRVRVEGRKVRIIP